MKSLTWNTWPVAFSLGVSSSSGTMAVEIVSSTFTFARDLAKSSYSCTCEAREVEGVI